MGRAATSFARRKPHLKPQPRTLIVCEDSRSCLGYLIDAAHHFRSFADVEIAHVGNTDPLGIVRKAVSRRNAYERIYCVIDRDSHAQFNEALALAAQHQIDAVVSYPCYEFWLLLHFRMTRAPYMPAGNRSAADCVVHSLRLEQGMDNYAKGQHTGVFDSLRPRLSQARQRAEQVLVQAVAEAELNPSTRIHHLLSALEALGTPQPAQP